MGLFKKDKESIKVSASASQPSQTSLDDPSAFIIDNNIAEFLLCYTAEVKYMCLFAYVYLHGCKLWPKFKGDERLSYKIINLFMACFGGGILVPVFINKIPVVLAQDIFFVATMVVFFLHAKVPMLRDVVALSAPLKVILIIMFESFRAGVCISLLEAGRKAIEPSYYNDVAVIGPIMCGAIAGCGGAFLPFNKGLDPIKKSGLVPPMITALIGSTYYHTFLYVGEWAEGIVDADKKAHLTVTLFFIINHLHDTFTIKKDKKD